MNSLPTVLIVEDNADDYEAAMRSFRRNHFVNKIEWFKNGKEILEYLKDYKNIANEQIIVLLDLNMPGMDGIQVLKEIKADSKLKLIPIIILTTSNDERDVEECYKNGASTYISKPVSFEGLVSAIAIMKEYWFGFAMLPKVKE